MERLNKKENESKFLSILLSKVKDVYAKHLGIYIDQKEKPEIAFEEYGEKNEISLKRIFKRYNNISDSLEKLLLIEKFIKSNFVIDFCKNNELNEIDYYQYNFENFLVRLVGLLDLCAKIGNEVYELDIEERKCNWYRFTNHQNIIGKKCCTVLLSFSHYLQSIKDYRHIILHAGGFESDQIKSIESKIFNERLIPLEKPIKDWFESQKNEEIKRLVDFINNKIENALNYTYDFLDSMDADLKIK